MTSGMGLSATDFARGLIRLLQILVPQRLRADWRQEQNVATGSAQLYCPPRVFSFVYSVIEAGWSSRREVTVPLVGLRSTRSRTYHQEKGKFHVKVSTSAARESA